MFTALLWGISSAAPPSAATYHAALAAPEGWQEVAVRHHDAVGDIRVRHKKVAGIDCLEGIAMTQTAIEPSFKQRATVSRRSRPRSPRPTTCL